MVATKQEVYGTTCLPENQKLVSGNRINPAVVGIPGDKFGPDGSNDTKAHRELNRILLSNRVRESNSFDNKLHAGNNHPIHPDNYFTEFTAKKAFLYGAASLYVMSCGAISFAELFLTLPCPSTGEEELKFPNPAYDGSRCPHIRQLCLLGLTPTECSFGRRLVMSILMGGLIGWERRQADRPAGIRTMSLVSLGSCLFTINSAFAFIGGPMAWDASRISAAIPSGVGFLGAGLIFKKTNAEEDNMVVHGLTTAASVWLSAAVGIACGGELYFAASFGTCLMMLLLRFGPRGSDHDEEEYDDDGDAEQDQEQGLPETFGAISLSKIEIPRGPSGVGVGLAAADETTGGGARGDGATSMALNTMELRNVAVDGGQIFPPGLNLTQRSEKSVDGSYTVTGESIENNSFAAETTPMLVPSQSGGPFTPPRSSRSLSQLQRKPYSKADRVRKRHSKANLGSIV